ncbi:DUF3558 family protein [Nocardia salmonicida]|uniref:DUF3558 family protein n=1 Tax=Nocardia salmonicida TaxID=53431 RepID=UPI0007A3A03F|nr:DUF3558 family protein [Nocardia salmonicida]
MNQTKLASVYMAALVITGAVTGCSGDDPTKAPTTKTPGPIAVQVPAPALRDNPGREPVTFDPCTSFDDDAVVRAGFTPRTRERADFIADTYSVVGCKFKDVQDGRPARILTIDLSNVPLHEQSYFDTAVDRFTIDGREAIIYELSGSMKSGSCFLAMSSDGGSASVHVEASPVFQTGDPCAKIKDIATIYAGELPA